jgi:hypothetical protein
MYLTLHTIKWRTSGVSTPNQDAVIKFSRLTSGVRSILTVDSSKPSPPPPLLLLRPPLPSLATTPTRLKSLGISRSATCSLGSFDRCFLPVYEVGICMQSRSSVTLNHRTPLEISNPNVPVIQTSPDVVVKKKTRTCPWEYLLWSYFRKDLYHRSLHTQLRRKRCHHQTGQSSALLPGDSCKQLIDQDSWA